MRAIIISKKIFAIKLVICLLSCDTPRLYMLNNSLNDKLTCDGNNFELFFSKSLVNTSEAITIKNLGDDNLKVTKLELNGKALEFEINKQDNVARIGVHSQRFAEKDKIHLVFSINQCRYDKTYAIGRVVKVSK
ncbi:hypothetical protein [Pedobacter xixiisoli]|uniref:Uncharacterized protein n=1 Tax=Pedobacter xixiisoli TaxID=1476464 RepID=A0A286AEQ2_9SPHI|nr:hypothetical protein [Pedobacter xixiisoli]SOD20384.1 hypothetical protein SAMN06297358_4101 [Pedobacter xixiisoli]